MSPNKKHSSGTALALLAGLVAAQIIATAHVYRSDLQLYRQTVQLAETGYLSVPNPATAPQLRQMDSALAGGLFFSLSAGAALALLALGAAWLWVHGLSCNRRFLFAFGLLLLAGVYSVNRNGFNPEASLYVAVVPAVVFLVYAGRSISGPRPPIAAPLIGLGLLAACWWTVAGPNLFLNVRDTLLLSNPVGTAVNDFYYRNTLFAAEAFKSPGQRLQKACLLAGETGTAEGLLLERALRTHDCLAVRGDGPKVMTVRLQAEAVALLRGEETVLQVPLEEMLAGTGEVLQEFSRVVDRWSAFRSLCYFGVLLAFPTLLYAALYIALKKTAGRWWRPSIAAWLAAGICLAAGIGCLLPAVALQKPPDRFVAISIALGSDSGLQRNAALQAVTRQKLEIADFPDYRQTLQSHRPSERYWAARALGVSRNPATVDDLMRLLNDPHPNVVCQALAALGQRRIVAAIPQIRILLESSTHWYVQRYGYLALRSLGWVQPALITAP